MCGGGSVGGSDRGSDRGNDRGVGSANNPSNDNESGSGNSFGETLANIFTPGDGMSYVDGRLTENRSVSDPSRARFYDYNPDNNNDDGPGYTTIMVDGQPQQIRRDANDAYKQKYVSALFGAATGGLPGLLGSLAMNSVTQGATGQAALNTADTAGGVLGGIRGLFTETAADSTMGDMSTATGVAPEQSLRPQARPGRARPGQRAQVFAEPDANRQPAAVAPTVAPTVALPGSTSSPTMSASAGEGGFQPIPNPNYDPTDPMSPMFLSNPTYEQLLAYRDTGQVPGMAQGGLLSWSIGTPQPNPMDQNPLQQYGGYLERQYGDAGFDQKKDQFLQEVQQKEQQTFSGGGLQASNFRHLNQQPASLGRAFLGMPQGRPGQLGMPEGYDKIQSPFPQNLMRGFAEGGEVTGGNEKTAISDAVSAIKGELSEVRAALVLGRFLESYGEDALRNLVTSVQSGELDDTVDRFANGEAGEVRGPGDGSGIDDKVPASLEGQQDVLLADGEFVLRKKTADALQKKYGGGFLDAVNKAENDAPRTMQQYMASN